MSNTVPCSATRPFSSTATRSAIARTTSSSWVMTTMVTPSSALTLRRRREHVLGGLRVERAGGLVGQQDLRRRRERAGDADALLLPAGQLVGVGVRAVQQPDEVEQLGDAPVAVGLGPAGDLERERDVAGDGPRREQVELLEDHADVAALELQLALGERRDVGAVDDQLPGRHALEAVDQAHEGALAGTGVPDDAEDLPGLDGEAHAVDRTDGAARGVEDLAHVAELDDGGHAQPLGGRAGASGRRPRPGGVGQPAALRFASVSLRTCWSFAAS